MPNPRPVKRAEQKPNRKHLIAFFEDGALACAVVTLQVRCYNDVMSKAFTRESDAAPDASLLPRLPEPLPPGVKNYMTPGGAERLRLELKFLIEVERPRAADIQDSARRAGALQALDLRIAYLNRSLGSASIVPSPTGPQEQVRFGTEVVVRNRENIESRYRIVGIDEIDLDRGWISWRSPLAKALLNARVGQRVKVTLPAGEERLEILSVSGE